MSDEDLIRYRRIPRRLIEVVRKPLQDTPALSFVRRFMAHKESCLLVLSGGAGSGKSVAAAWAVISMTGVWTEAGEFARIPQRDEYGNLCGFDPGRRAEETPLLVIDDVGSEYSGSKGYAVNRIQEAIIHREARNMRTIVTTNLSAQEFPSEYGDRVASRIDGDPLGWGDVGHADLRHK